MKDFSELGIKPIENKKIFRVPKISITDILNVRIEVLDFEVGIKTPHGDNRYVVKIKVNNEEQKFITDSSYIKSTLDRVPKSEFPFATTIKKESFGGSDRGAFCFT